MAVTNKHLATVLLGAAAAYGALKYSKMTEEEKEKLAGDLKDKFHKLKTEAEGATETAKGYFNDLKSQASELLKQHFPDMEKHFTDFFSPKPAADPAAPAAGETA